MTLSKYFFLIVMVVVSLVGAIFFIVSNNELVISYFIVINLFFSYFAVYRYAPDITLVKLSFVYLLGFSLFICGRFFANILGASEIYCFDFGYNYCLNQMEILYSYFLISSSLIFFLYGFLSYKHQSMNLKNNHSYYNKYILYIFVFLGLLLGVYTLYGTIQSIFKAISTGYLSLYASQVEEYTSPIDLMIMIFFNATVALSFSFRNKINKSIYSTIILIFLLNLIISILSGSRANFVSAILIILWLFMGNNKLNFSKIFITCLLGMLVILTNSIASITGARGASESDANLYTKIVEDILYNQGITMMVFNMGVLEDNYPLLAYIKTIFPGFQIVYSWFFPIYQYELSFSQYLMYKLSPSLFYDGYGLAWSLLGDFYAFSFGFVFLFFFYNFIWGKLIKFVSAQYGSNYYYNGIYFCFLMSVFILNRFSISSFLVLIIFYYLIYQCVRIKWR